MKKLIYLFLLLINIFFLYSCYDYIEVNSYYYASSLGLDYNDEKNEYTVYIYIINTLNLSNIQTSSTEKDSIAYVAKYTSDSIPSAVHKIFENSDIHIDLRHLRTLILKDSFINKKNLDLLINLIKNDINFYFNFAVYVTKDKIEDIYKVNNFTETSAYMTLLTMTNNYDNYHLSYYPNLVNDLYSKIISYNYPIIKAQKEVFEKNEKDYITIHLGGYALFNNEYELIYFDDNQFPGIIYLNNRTNFQITLSNYLITYNINQYNITYSIKNNQFYLNINLVGYNTTNDSVNTKFLEQEIKNQLMELFNYSKKEHVDIFQINHLSKIKNCNLDFQNIELNFNFNIKIN